MGFLSGIGKALGGATKALTPGLGGGFNPVKNMKNAGAALGGAPGMGAVGGALAGGAKPMAGTAQGSVAPGGAAAPGAMGAILSKVAAAKGLGAPAGAPTKELAAPSMALGAGDPGMAAAPALSKKSFFGSRGMRGGRR